MLATAPHYVLLAETQSGATAGRWRFVLAHSESGEQLAAGDFEPGVQGERLELLSLVRGLEALDQPSRVTVVTGSRYVRQGLMHGLREWRENDWCWERFGELTPVKHLDLWQRVDQALKFHQVDCRTWRFDAPHKPAAPIHRPMGEPPQRKDEPGPARAALQADGTAASPRRAPSRRPWLNRLGERLVGRQPALAGR